MIQDAAAGFSSALQLADPQKAKSSSLHGAGLRLGEIAGEELTPIVVARNIGNKTAVLRGRIPYTGSDGSIDILPLREINLRPGEVKQWEIREARGLKGSAGLEFDYDTEPGSVIVSALSVSRSGNHVFQVPMLDVAVQKSSTGVYPFYFYGSSSTVVYIKNTTAVEQKYVAHMNYEGGNYMMGVKSIAPGETVTIDIRALRDNQVADQEQRTIPHDVAHGQVRWTIIQSEGTDLLALIGRSEQVDEVKAISSTYACQNCCGDSPQSVFISPSQVNMQVGQSITMSAFEQRVDCYGFAYLVPVSASWSSNNNSVATVSGGQVTSQGAGQATITASWNAFTSVPGQCGPGFGPPPIEPTTCCRSASFFRSASASVQVAASPDHLVVVGEQQGFTTQLPGGGTCPNPYFLRQVVFRVVSSDANGALPVGNVVVEERFDSVTTNTCGNGQPQAASCAPTVNNGTFIDTISPGCGSASGPENCGYDINWKWYWCGNGTTGIQTLASLTAHVRKGSVTLNGRSTAWPAGTAFRP